MDKGFNIVFLGASSVGKTSIIQRMAYGEFKDTGATMGVTFVPVHVELHDKKKVKLNLHDTAGQERYRSLAKITLNKANAVILVYDITNTTSFEDLGYWVGEVNESLSEGVLLYIIGNKSDLIEQEAVSMKNAHKYADDAKAKLKIVSAKNGQNIEDLRVEIAQALLDSVASLPQAPKEV